MAFSLFLQRGALVVGAEGAGELVAYEEEAAFVEGAAQELEADGQAIAHAHGHGEAGQAGEVQRQGEDVHEVHLERIAGHFAHLPCRNGGDGGEEHVALLEGVEIVLADEAAHLGGLAVVGVVVAGGEHVGTEQDAALYFKAEAFGTRAAILMRLQTATRISLQHIHQQNIATFGQTSLQPLRLTCSRKAGSRRLSLL